MGRGSAKDVLPTLSGGWEAKTNDKGQAVRLRMTRANDAGVLPTQIGLLRRLLVISVPGSRLSGTVPTEIGALTRLQRLTLSNVPALSGTIPTEIGNLQKSFSLSLAEASRLSGTLPTEVGRLPDSLAALQLSGLPRLSGTLPADIGGPCSWPPNSDSDPEGGRAPLNAPIGAPYRCHLLSHLNLSHNDRLSGTIPSNQISSSRVELHGWRIGISSLSLQANGRLSGTAPAVLRRHFHQLDLSGDPRLTPPQASMDGGAGKVARIAPDFSARFSSRWLPLNVAIRHGRCLPDTRSSAQCTNDVLRRVAADSSPSVPAPSTVASTTATATYASSREGPRHGFESSRGGPSSQGFKSGSASALLDMCASVAELIDAGADPNST